MRRQNAFLNLGDALTKSGNIIESRLHHNDTADLGNRDLILKLRKNWKTCYHTNSSTTKSLHLYYHFFLLPRTLTIVEGEFVKCHEDHSVITAFIE